MATNIFPPANLSAVTMNEDRLAWKIVTDPQFAGGAKGDGTTNDTAAFQAAITAAIAAGGGQVYVPTGSYRWNAPITWSGNHVTLQGADRGTYIRADFTSGDTLTINGAHNEVRSLAFWPLRQRSLTSREINVPSFENLTLDSLRFPGNDGPNGTAVAYIGYAMQIGSASTISTVCHITNIRAAGYERCLHMTNVLDFWIARWSIGAQKNNTTDMWLDGDVEGGTIRDIDVVNAIDDGPNATSGCCLRIDQQQLTDASRPPDVIKIINFLADSHYNGIHIVKGAVVKILGTWFSTRRGAGLIIEPGVVGVTVGDCDFVNCDGQAIVSAGNDLNIHDTLFAGNCKNGAAPAVLIKAASDGAIIRGNRITNNMTGSPWFATQNGLHTYGIQIEAGASNFVVKDNDVRGNTTGGINNLAGTGSTKIVSDNIGA